MLLRLKRAVKNVSAVPIAVLIRTVVVAAVIRSNLSKTYRPTPPKFGGVGHLLEHIFKI